MRPESFRFRPPPHELPAAVRWVLQRAFGPLPPRPLPPPEPEAALGWARALGLLGRIAARQRPDTDLPGALAARLEDAHAATVARSLLLRRLLERAVETAATLGTPLIALKGIALLESGTSDWGARPLLDLDLLVPADRAHELHRTLEGAGLSRSGAGEDHHLPPLADPKLGELELHTHIPGLALAGAAPARAEDLRRAGLTRPSERLPGLELPAAELLTAHALAHALDQHGLSPSAYPVTRLLADLVDLGPVPVEGWIAPSVSRRELRAAEALRDALAAGEPERAGADGDALLRHTVLALSSPRYRRRQRRRAALRALRRRQWSKFRSELHRRVGARSGLQ